MALAVKVEKKNAERMRRYLVRKGILDSRWSIKEEDDFVYFPIKERIDGAIEIPLEPRHGKEEPYLKIRSILNGKGMKVDIPRKWERIGDVLLLPNFKIEESEYREVGEAYAKVLNVKTVVMYGGISGELRVQKVKKIWGNGTETVHVENGIKYMLDVSRIMFSSGNVEERIRMARTSFAGKTVVDMFAGIGYFTLPASLTADRVYACEKNPVSFHYLLRNRDLNNRKNVIPLLGDNRRVCPHGVGDVVIMGYFDTEQFLPYAFAVLKSRGKIYYHDLVKEGREKRMKEKIVERARASGYEVKIEKIRTVKSYAPRVWHVVVELLAEKH